MSTAAKHFEDFRKKIICLPTFDGSPLSLCVQDTLSGLTFDDFQLLEGSTLQIQGKSRHVFQAIDRLVGKLEQLESSIETIEGKPWTERNKKTQIEGLLKSAVSFRRRVCTFA